MSQRLQRVQELLKRQLGEIIRREIPLDQGGLITVNEVEVASDLHLARVFVSITGSDHQKAHAITLLRKERVKIQGMVARSVILKYTPRLRFIADDSIERGNRVLRIIEELEAGHPPPEENPPDA